MSAHSGALEAIDRLLNRGEGDVPARAVAVLHERLFAWVGFVPGGPEAGERPPAPRLSVPVVREGAVVAELQADPREPDAEDERLLRRVALLVSHLL